MKIISKPNRCCERRLFKHNEQSKIPKQHTARPCTGNQLALFTGLVNMLTKKQPRTGRKTGVKEEGRKEFIKHKTREFLFLIGVFLEELARFSNRLPFSIFYNSYGRFFSHTPRMGVIMLFIGIFKKINLTYGFVGYFIERFLFLF